MTAERRWLAAFPLPERPTNIPVPVEGDRRNAKGKPLTVRKRALSGFRRFAALFGIQKHENEDPFCAHTHTGAHADCCPVDHGHPGRGGSAPAAGRSEERRV